VANDDTSTLTIAAKTTSEATTNPMHVFGLVGQKSATLNDLKAY